MVKIKTAKINRAMCNEAIILHWNIYIYVLIRSFGTQMDQGDNKYNRINKYTNLR